jgi:hypothetical protein
MSYDSVELLRHFADRLGITIPLLSDPKSKVIRAFGIFNHNIPLDNHRYGVPFPGSYLVDASGVVIAKYFEQNLRERTTAATVLTRQYGVAGGNQIHIENDHFTIVAYPSQNVARRGNRLTLVLALTTAAKTHLYAPGAGDNGYTPVDFSIDEKPFLTAHGARYPEPAILEMPFIDERIPIYEGTVRIAQDVTIAHDYEETGEIKVTGNLEYQACYETFCYAPDSIPIRFELELVPHDLERVPENLRKIPR